MTVTAVVAEPAAPAVVAKVALATIPVTLAPVKFVKAAPLPVKRDPYTLPPALT